MASVARAFPVVETFGPTIQGEGALAGLSTHFVRFGGCDYRCSWCDSMYAVEPKLVRLAERLTGEEIQARIAALGKGPAWVTLSGGNPAMHLLGGFVSRLHEDGYKVCVETQGSRWRDWLGNVDCLTVSPKPPSSGMVTAEHEAETAEFMVGASVATREKWANGDPYIRALKIVVFDEADLDWATDVFRAYSFWPGYLSVGTDPVGEWGSDVLARVNDRQVRDGIGDRYKWLCDAVVARPGLAHVRVLPQLHVIAHGHARGV